MIHKLSVKNFKSIKQLEIDCRRINLFIGEPNVGKSNILETLGFLSRGGHESGALSDYVRFQYAQNLFYDNLTDEAVEIEIEPDYIIGARLTYSNERLFVTFKISENKQKDSANLEFRFFWKRRSGILFGAKFYKILHLRKAERFSREGVVFAYASAWL